MQNQIEALPRRIHFKHNCIRLEKKLNKTLFSSFAENITFEVPDTVFLFPCRLEQTQNCRSRVSRIWAVYGTLLNLGVKKKKKLKK